MGLKFKADFHSKNERPSVDMNWGGLTPPPPPTIPTLVICKEEDTDGRARVRADEERVIQTEQR